MRAMMRAPAQLLCTIAIGLLLFLPVSAQANLILSQVIVDIKPGDPPVQDIEVWNNGPDRSYLIAEPVEVVSAGQPTEHRVTNPDPSASGILVTPQRMILEAGQRRLVRVALVSPRTEKDRIYRVAIKPVAGDISAETSALKVLVGYDVLVIYRPEKMLSDVTAGRSGSVITFRNSGNTNVEMFEGRQCETSATSCKDLPANRLYPGAIWQVKIDPALSVQYRLATAGRSIIKNF